MIDLIRIVENQAALSSYRATQNEERAVQLELLIETTKPKNFFAEWHPLIATPFRYDPPHPNARFRPPYGRNVFYGSLNDETALYEHAFHFMRERLHLKLKSDTGIRTLFKVDADETNSIHLRTVANFQTIMDKNNYSASHQFIMQHPHASFILYPSCRDPQQRDNAAIFDIQHLGQNPKEEKSIKFFYDHTLQRITWIDYAFHIDWREVK